MKHKKYDSLCLHVMQGYIRTTEKQERVEIHQMSDKTKTARGECRALTI